MKQEFSETNRKVFPIVDKYGKKNALAGLVGDFFSNDILMNGAYLGYLVYQTVVRGALSYGSTMALFNASSSLKNSLRNLAMILPKFEQHGLYVEKIRTFQAFESSMECGEAKLEAEVNLSGGEAQKVAIARTFYKYCPVIILDEPSSALDPVSEYQLNQAMLDVASDKTVIFISHRLSSTVMADRIYMLEQGRIIEEGSHRTLMERNGKYAQMFRMQAEKYNMRNGSATQ